MKGFVLALWVQIGMMAALADSIVSAASSGPWWPLVAILLLIIAGFSFVGCLSLPEGKAEALGWVILLGAGAVWAVHGFVTLGSSGFVPVKIGAAIVFALSALIGLFVSKPAAASGH